MLQHSFSRETDLKRKLVKSFAKSLQPNRIIEKKAINSFSYEKRAN